MSTPLATATAGHLPRSALGIATEGLLGLAVVAPPVVDDAESQGGFGPWFPLPQQRRESLEGSHRGANWATGELSARVTAGGAGVSRSLSFADEPRAASLLDGEHGGATANAANPRAVSPRSVAARRRNARAAILFLTILRSRQP